MKNLFVGNLPFTATEDELRDLFSAFGEVQQVRIMTDRDTGKSRGFAFVEIADDEAAAKAIADLNGKEFGSPSMKPVPSPNVEAGSAQAGAVALEESDVVAAVDVAAHTGSFLPANRAGKKSPFQNRATIRIIRRPGRRETGCPGFDIANPCRGCGCAHRLLACLYDKRSCARILPGVTL
jgi:RNA recognition motif-containing protein